MIDSLHYNCVNRKSYPYNSVEDNNSNDIPVPMDFEHECTICNALFQTKEEDKYTCELLIRSKQIATN